VFNPENQRVVTNRLRQGHYRLRKPGERQLDLEKAEVLTLAGISAAVTGAAPSDEQKALREIVSTMNGQFSGDIREADFLGGVAAWRGHLMANGSLAEQANSEEQFSMVDFKNALMDVVIDAKDASMARNGKRRYTA
jgi:type I restriction enzyme R subunit